MKKYRILMIGWEYPPHITGGLAIASHGLARSLGSLGHQVYFFVPRLTGQEPNDPNVSVIGINSKDLPLTAEELRQFLVSTKHLAKTSVYAKPDQPGDPQGLNLNELFSKELTGMMNAGADPSLVMQKMQAMIEIHGGYGDNIYAEIQAFAEFVARMSLHIDFDIIHAHDWMTYPAGLYVAHLTQKPLIAHVHATEFDRSGDHPNEYVYNLERHTYHNAAGVVTVSNYTRSILMSKYGVAGQQIFAVHNAAEFELTADLTVERPIRERIVLFLGRITFQKGPDYFVRAAQKVIQYEPNVRFVMVGTGDLYHRMIEMAADLGIGRYFFYTGFLKRPEIEKIFRMSDLYVLPSVSEPFGISALEAMVAGVPTIISRQSGVSEVIDNCIKVNFWDVDDIAQNIVQILKNNVLHSQLASGGRQEALNLSWDDSAKRISGVYDTILKRVQKSKSKQSQSLPPNSDKGK